MKREIFSINTDNLEVPVNRFIEKSYGKYLFTNSRKIHFRPREPWLDFNHIPTPIPVRATAVLKTKDQIEVVSKIPIGGFFLMLLLFFIFNFFMISSILDPGDSESIFASAGLFLLMIGAFFLFYRVEKKKLNNLKKEFLVLIDSLSENKSEFNV
ncbi:hypothetical protein GWK08_15915 [Leptobacterium flavescens]|uniref:Uncharacterized protein n=1 Tax=Leptobacterium flavescens TaxID=472055 RepID=A0A6P0UVX8_9FLAO|nr:hypothetical protein [Leptobacterium flavescens]NER14943.1 hypothetical protein [Leptobacterium flavescens]